jgi:hypothetical protein
VTVTTTSSDTTAELARVANQETRGRPRRRRRLIATGAVLVVVVVGAGIGIWIANPFATPGHATNGTIDSADPTSLATVTQQTVSSQTEVPGTLGYAGTYSVVVPASSGQSGAQQSASSGQLSGGSPPSGGGASSGTFTALPAAGQVVSQGQSLYSISLSPVVLLYGATPASRNLSEGMTGADVAQLNGDLVALGDATSSQLDPASDYFSAATAAALEKLQGDLGVTKTGTLDLGQAVFLPTAAKITAVDATLGGPAQAGAQVLQASSTTRQVVADIETTQQSDVAVGDQVTITLPDTQTTPGTVTSIGTVASSSATGNGSGSGSSSTASGSSSSAAGGVGSTPTIAVDITPSDPSATGALDQAPVEVTITTASVNNALVVPVAALVALANGGYAIEVAGAADTRHLVPATLGLFDDADGLVQIHGPGISAGQHVVIPAQL